MTQARWNRDTLNLNRPDLLGQELADDAFRHLRAKLPVYWYQEGRRNVGFWNITKYEDVMFISRHPDLITSSKEIFSAYPRHVPEIDPEADDRGKHLIKMDPPRHDRMRRLVNRGFTPSAVNALEPLIREITGNILDDIERQERVDFVIDVASRLPLAVVCELVGIPKENRPITLHLTNKMLRATEPEYQADVPDEIRGTPEATRLTMHQGIQGMRAHIREHLRDRSAGRPDQLLSLLVDPGDCGTTITDDEIEWFAVLLMNAGQETTRNAISGGFRALCEHPGERRRLQEDMSLLPSAVEEILRWVSPVARMARVATGDVEIRRKQIKEGERVVMWYPSANFDEDVFEDPYTFDITRDPNDHLAFGIGEHGCLGAGFARLELKVMFEELFRRFPAIRLDGDPDDLCSNFIGGVKHLPVRLA